VYGGSGDGFVAKISDVEVPNATPTITPPPIPSQTFPETGQTMKGRFLEYWKTHGGLAQQGFPISEEREEISDVNGSTYPMQYFERAVFEYHPENQQPNDVLLSLLGNFLYKKKYPNGAPAQMANNSPGSVSFPQTGKRLGGKFLDYWNTHGGLAQQGYPISDEFKERSDLDGKEYTVQYFERAVFELHSENAGTQYEVLLSQLGRFRYDSLYTREVYSGNGWYISNARGALAKLVPVNTQGLDKLADLLGPGRRLEIHIARDAKDAVRIAVSLHMDANYFQRFDGEIGGQLCNTYKAGACVYFFDNPTLLQGYNAEHLRDSLLLSALQAAATSQEDFTRMARVVATNEFLSNAKVVLNLTP
jgi:hypothetical protein